MKNNDRNAFLSRDRILTLLSDSEVASVSTAETASGLRDGEDYVDLMHLERGVLHAHGAAAVMGQVVPRKAVHPDTWTRILAELEPVPVARPGK